MKKRRAVRRVTLSLETVKISDMISSGSTYENNIKKQIINKTKDNSSFMARLLGTRFHSREKETTKYKSWSREKIHDFFPKYKRRSREKIQDFFPKVQA